MLVSLPLGTEGGPHGDCEVAVPGSRGEKRWGKETDEHNLVWKLYTFILCLVKQFG